MTAPTASNIEPNKTVVVQGSVSFARTASVIDGPELERRIKNSKSKHPTFDPHTLISLSQCKIVPANPAQLSWEEAYIQSLFYGSKTHPEKGLNYEAKNVTRNLPALIAADPENPGGFRQIVDVEGEIAKDTVVQIAVKTFQSIDKRTGQPYDKLGVGLEAIIVPTTEVPWAPKAGARNLDLSSYGITFSGPLVPTNGVESEVTGPAAGTDESGLPAAPTQPTAPSARAQQVAPVSPFAPSAPAQSVAPESPFAPSAPVQQVAPAAPAQPAAPVAPAAPAQPAAPVAPAAPAQPIVPVASAYQVPAPAAPASAASNPDDPFAGAPAPNWGGTGIHVPA